MNIQIIKKNPLTIPVVMAEKMGVFKKFGVDVNVIAEDDFTFGTRSLYGTGESDAMMGDLTFFFYNLEKGRPSVLTSNLTRTIHLVTRDGLQNKKDGLVIGANRTGMLRLFLENDLKDVLTNTKIVWINNTYDRIKSFNNGEIDALVAIEPFIDELVENGAKKIYSTRSSNENMVMWCFNEDYYNNNKKDVKAFHMALEECMSLYNDMTVEEKFLLTKDIMGYDYLAAKRASKFTFEKRGNVTKEDFEKCMKWMYENNEITKLYDAENLIKKIF